MLKFMALMFGSCLFSINNDKVIFARAMKRTRPLIIVGALVAVSVFLFRKELARAFAPSITEISLTVRPNKILSIGSMQAKIIELKQIGGKATGEATIQWRCKVRNGGPDSVRFGLVVEFCDDDGFIRLNFIGHVK